MASVANEHNPDNNNNSAKKQPPLFSLGVVADIQYADMADSHVEGRTQRFRECPAKLDAALATMRREAARGTGRRDGGDFGVDDDDESGGGGRLAAVLALGDIINGNREDASLTPSDLETVASIIDKHFPADAAAADDDDNGNDDGNDDKGRRKRKTPVPVYHVLGNHCLDVPKSHVTERLRFPPSALPDEDDEEGGERGKEGKGNAAAAAAPPPACYSVPLRRGWRLVALDTTEMSGHAQDPPGSSRADEAAAYLLKRPLIKGGEEGGGSLGLEDPQMSPWNGGPGARQVEWLRRELAAAASRGEKCVVAGHHQVGPGKAVRRTHAAWNWREVAEVVSGGRIVDGVEVKGEDEEGEGEKNASKSSSAAAVLYLAGHDHEGGYTKAGGVHFLTLEAIVEAPKGSNAFAVLDFYDDEIVVRGFGSATSRRLEL